VLALSPRIRSIEVSDAISTLLEILAALRLRANVEGTNVFRLAFGIQHHGVDDPVSVFASVQHGVPARTGEHFFEVEPQVRSELKASAEVLAQLALTAKPAVGAAPTADHGLCLELNVVRVVIQDAFQVMGVPRDDPRMRVRNSLGKMDHGLVLIACDAQRLTWADSDGHGLAGIRSTEALGDDI
jgi:hypothetical protein